MTSIPRSNLARHREHVESSHRRLGIVPPGPGDVHRMDPLGEALGLLARARTQREKLRALDSIRASTALMLKALGDDPDEQLLERLDQNVAEAQAAFNETAGFESQLYALSGYREAIKQRIAAVRQAETFTWTFDLVSSVINPDGSVAETDRSGPITVPLAASAYWTGAPARYRDATRYRVWRSIQLELNGPGRTETKVYEIAADSLVWASD